MLEFISEKNNRANRMSIKLNRDKVKKFSYNGIALKKVSEFIGHFRAVLFTPDHLGLVKGSPENRRKFIDTAISQIKPVYLSYLSDYERVLTQRNHLLKLIREKGQTKENLAQFYIWTKKLVRYCAIITRYRGEYIGRLKEFAPEFYAGLSSGRENISFVYISHVNQNNQDFADYNNFEECENLYDNIFALRNKEELSCGTTLYGAHRDDLHIDINGKPARGIASQGQQRSAVLALKLAEGNVSRISHGEYPAFLFDDILSELDKTRQDFILKNLENRQVIITCCNTELLKDIKIDKMIEVRNGEFY
jgi:DNA replication and repair protein RecF